MVTGSGAWHRCLEVYGLRVQGFNVYEGFPGCTVRVLSLRCGI